jgi:hypothetical protein
LQLLHNTFTATLPRPNTFNMPGRLEGKNCIITGGAG